MSRLVSLLLLLFVCPSLFADGFEDELLYQGRSLRDWLAEARGSDVAARKRATRMLRFVGPEAHEAAPALLLALRSSDHTTRLRVAGALARLGPRPVPLLTASLGLEDVPIGYGAARALGELGPAGKPALRALTRHLRLATAPNLRAGCAIALWRIDRRTTGLAPLRKQLTDDPIAQMWAALALEAFGPAAAPAAQDLVGQLGSKNDHVRAHVFDALVAIGEAAVAPLVEALSSPTSGVRVEAAEALGRLGPQARGAVPVLVKQLKDGSAGPRVSAARALGRIGQGGEAVLSGLRTGLRDSESDLRQEAARALGALGSAASPLVSDLGVAGRDPSAPVRKAATEALVRIGKPGVHALAALLEEEDDLVRRQALLALQAIGPDAVAALAALRKLLNDPGTSLRLVVLDTLAAIGAPSVGTLASALSGDLELRTHAARALARLGPYSAPIRPALIDTLRHPNTSPRLAVLAALASQGPVARDATSTLLRLDDEDSDLRAAVLGTLAAIGAGKDCLPLLRKALADRTASVRSAALVLAASLGAQAKPLAADVVPLLHSKDLALGRQALALLLLLGEEKRLVPPLARLLADGSPHQRRLALSCVPALGAASKELLPATRKLLDGPDLDLAIAAGRALWQTGTPAKDVLAILLPSLGDSLEHVHRPAAFGLLEEMASEARLAMPALRRIVEKESDLLLRTRAARVLGAIGPEAHEALPALFGLLLDIDRHQDVQIDEQRDNLGPATGPIRLVPLPAPWLHADADLRLQHDRASRAFHERGRPGLAGLERMVREAADLLRQEVLRAITAMGPAGVPVARKDLSDELVDRRRVAAAVLARLGPRSREALPELRRALADPDVRVVVEAARAVYATTGDRVGVAHVLVRALEADEPATAALAADALADLGPAAAQPALPALLAVLRRRPFLVREAAARAVAALGPTSQAVREGLRERLRDPNWGVQLEAGASLARIEESHDPLPLLMDLLRREANDRVRARTLRALEHLGPRARPAALLVRRFCTDPNAEVRTAAARALLACGGDQGLARRVLATIACSGQERTSTRLLAFAALDQPGPAALNVQEVVLDATAPGAVREAARRLLVPR